MDPCRRMSEFQLIAATLDVRHCKPTLQPSSSDFYCPIDSLEMLPFFPCADFCFPRENLASGCPRSDDSHLARPTASPVLLIGLVRSVAEGQANHDRGT